MAAVKDLTIRWLGPCGASDHTARAFIQVESYLERGQDAPVIWRKDMFLPYAEGPAAVLREALRHMTALLHRIEANQTS